MNPICIKAFVQRLLVKYPCDVLMVTRVINDVLFLLLITAHWITGGFGYLIGLTLSNIGVLLVYIVWVWLKSLWPRKRFVLAALWAVILLALAWADFRFLAIIILNDGFYPCIYGASCP